MVSVISPSMAPAATLAFPSPNAMRTTLRASKIEPTPIVIARVGTFSSPKKSLAASLSVTRSR